MIDSYTGLSLSTRDAVRNAVAQAGDTHLSRSATLTCLAKERKSQREREREREREIERERDREREKE